MNSNYNIPNYIEKYNVYDVFFNDDNQLIIIMPYLKNPYNIEYITHDEKLLPFEFHNCPHNHTFIYSLTVEYNENIKIKINDVILETYVNKYPTFKDEILFSTIVKDEDDYIKTWIDYHLRLGISRFIIYDNSNRGTLSEILDEYIKNNRVLLIKWTYPYRLDESGISGQTTQQNHSIYAFKNSKYIGLFDIDEYVNIQNHTKIDDFFEDLITKDCIELEKISSFRFLNRFFFNPNYLNDKDGNFLKIFSCDNITESGREKNFAIPKNVNTFAVHMVTSGKEMYNVDKKHGYFNHYCYLNKHDRGRENRDLIDESILLHLS